MSGTEGHFLFFSCFSFWLYLVITAWQSVLSLLARSETYVLHRATFRDAAERPAICDCSVNIWKIDVIEWQMAPVLNVACRKMTEICRRVLVHFKAVGWHYAPLGDCGHKHDHNTDTTADDVLCFWLCKSLAGNIFCGGNHLNTAVSSASFLSFLPLFLHLPPGQRWCVFYFFVRASLHVTRSERRYLSVPFGERGVNKERLKTSRYPGVSHYQLG